MPSAPRSGQRLGARAPAPVVLHSAPLVLPISAPPIRDGAVAVRGDKVLQVGARAELRACFPVQEERRWTGVIAPGLVDAFQASPWPGALAHGVTAAAGVMADPHDCDPHGGIAYLEVRATGERAWEDHDRDALITALRETDHPGALGLALRTPDPHVLEDVAILARTFGLRLLADLDRHSPAFLDEAGALGPHCHVACGGPLDPGERKLLRLRRATVAIKPSMLSPGDVLALLEEGDRVALGSGAGRTPPLALARAIRDHARARGVRTAALDRTLVEAATLGGARALGLDTGPGRIGTLGPGSRADLAIFEARGRGPYAALLDHGRCVGTVLAGDQAPPSPAPSSRISSRSRS